MLARDQSHIHAINLPVHYIIEIEFNEGSSRLHWLNKNARKKGGRVSSPLYRASAQISMVFASGTLVKRLQTL